MSRLIKAPRGTFDILPEEMPLWLELEAAAREVFRRYGYSLVRTPLLEETRLFVRGIGETTDIVEKEMYTFPTKGRDEPLSLRPEATAGIVRAYIEHRYDKNLPLRKFAYMGPMFRYERPQAGRQRQFHQIGVEVLGTHSPEADVETIALALDIFKGVGLSGVTLKVNSIGCPKCRDNYRQGVRDFLGDRADKLCPDCKRRMERNVFRVLDCKVESCRELTRGVPAIDEYLCQDCRTHFERVLELLGELGIEYVKEKFLVRGLDYYTRTVYEFAHSALGARDAVGGGGRYDNLVEELGGAATGAVGFSIGSEATLLALKGSAPGASQDAPSWEPYAVLVLVDESVRTGAFKVLSELRAAGIAAEMPFDVRSVKSQMRGVNRCNARVAVILGPEEIARGAAKVKDMATGDESDVNLGELAEVVKQTISKPAS